MKKVRQTALEGFLLEKIEKLQLFLKEKEIDFAFITNTHHGYFFWFQRVIAVLIFSRFPPFLFFAHKWR